MRGAVGGGAGRGGLPIIVIPPAFGPGAPPSEIVITSRRSDRDGRSVNAGIATIRTMRTMWAANDAVT
jgi:hypothetical protein